MTTTTRRYRKRFLGIELFLPLLGAIITTYFSSLIMVSSPDIQQTATPASIMTIPVQSIVTKDIPIESPMDRLLPTIDAWTDDIDANASIMISNVVTGDSVSVRSAESYISASIYKLYVGYSILLAEQQGELDLDDTAVGRFSIADCLEAMIVVSDEECGIELGWLIGWDAIDKQLQDIGLTGTTIDNYKANGSFDGDKFTTAGDVDSFLVQLYSGKLLDTKQTETLLTLLRNQEINDRIPTELPDGVTIAHKTGNLYDNVHDAGYITTKDGDVYSFTVLSSGWTEQKDASVQFQSLLRWLSIELSEL